MSPSICFLIVVVYASLICTPIWIAMLFISPENSKSWGYAACGSLSVLFGLTGPSAGKSIKLVMKLTFKLFKLSGQGGTIANATELAQLKPKLGKAKEYIGKQQWVLGTEALDSIIDIPEWQTMPSNIRKSVHMLRAITAIQAWQPEKALLDCNAAESLGCKTCELYLTRARAKFALGMFTEVSEDATIAIRTDPKNVDGYLVKAGAMICLSKYEEALAENELALKVDSKSVSVFVNRATVLMGLKRLPEAASAAEQALSLSPNDTAALSAIAVVCTLMHKPSDSIKYCDRAIDLEPNCAGAYSSRAGAKSMRGDARGALDDYNKAISIFPQNELFGLRSVIHAKLGNELEALEDSAKSLELKPNNAGTLLLRGLMLSKLGKFDEAISVTLQSLPESIEKSNCHADLCGYYARVGKVDDALKEADLALQEDSENVIAYNNRAWILGHLNESATALTDIEKAFSLLPEPQPCLYSTRGFIFFTLNRFEDAIADFDKALEMDDTDGEAHFYRAEIFERMGEAAKATVDHDRATQLKFELVPFSKISGAAFKS